jgi:hypothetical protein
MVRVNYVGRAMLEPPEWILASGRALIPDDAELEHISLNPDGMICEVGYRKCGEEGVRTLAVEPPPHRED